ncbi:MAG: L-rhamnose mutarotase [Saprospiraceae bacterium]
MARYCFALDLIDDPAIITEYEKYHEAVWPDILQSLKDAGITDMEIYRVLNRLFMIIEGNELFSFERKMVMDKNNPRVREWEQLMWKYQQGLPGLPPGEKWMPAKLVFKL